MAMGETVDFLQWAALGLAALVAAAVIRLFADVVVFQTGLVFLRIISLGRIPGRSSWFQHPGHVSVVGMAVWFAIAVGVGLYNDMQKALW